MSAFFRTMAGRIGEDSLDLAQRFGVKVQGMQSADVARRRGSLDIMLNELRAGRKEKLGRSLTQFVIDQGGVQDTGGDVAALEVKGLVAETAEQIRSRQSQGTLPGQMPAQGKGLALDELGRKAVEALIGDGHMPLEVRPFTVAEALEAREAFVTAASSLVMPVVEIDGHKIGDGKPGPFAQKLRATYLDLARQGGRLG